MTQRVLHLGILLNLLQTCFTKCKKTHSYGTTCYDPPKAVLNFLNVATTLYTTDFILAASLISTTNTHTRSPSNQQKVPISPFSRKISLLCVKPRPYPIPSRHLQSSIQSIRSCSWEHILRGHMWRSPTVLQFSLLPNSGLHSAIIFPQPKTTLQH